MEIVSTHSVRAYADSRDIPLRQAFVDCFAGARYGDMKVILPISSLIQINKDIRTYYEDGSVPEYIVCWLEHEKIRQRQYLVRAGPGEPLWYGN